MRGLGPNSENCALGGLMYWAAGLHLYAPIPLAGMTKASGFFDLFRTHMFVNAGNLVSDSNLLQNSRGFQGNIDAAVQNFRLTYGIGIGTFVNLRILKFSLFLREIIFRNEIGRHCQN